jgi:8-oxo-dGTP diphosphatase
VVIETPRLRIRSYWDADLADLVALAGDWEIARWVGTIPHPYTEVDGREWIARVQENHATGSRPVRKRRARARRCVGAPIRCH